MAVRDCRWLQRGDSGDDVKAYQQAANVWMAHQEMLGIRDCGTLSRPDYLVEDGVFGPKTEAVTVWLQCRFGLEQDGLAGSQTLGALAKFLRQEGLGDLELRALPPNMASIPECVTPLRYTATPLANEHRRSAGLAVLPLPGEDGAVGDGEGGEQPRNVFWIPWAAGLALIAVGLRLWRGRR